LGAALPGSGGSYRYLLESYGPERWGRLMAFLFIWQFLISGPLELASGLIALAGFLAGMNTDYEEWKWRHVLWLAPAPEGGSPTELAVTVSTSRLAALAIGVLILVLLYRRITTLGRMTLVVWLGVLTVMAWILVEGLLHAELATAFDLSAAAWPADFGSGLGKAMLLAVYSYLGYYSYIGDEVRDPARSIPRAILLSAVLVCLLFGLLHISMLGVVPWRQVAGKEDYNLPADFMRRIYGREWAPVLVTALLVWSCFGSAFAGLLAYSRIPYGAARYGHFFAALGRVHPTKQIPHVGLWLVGGLTLFWTLFDLQSVINALLATRILDQFCGQIVGLMLLRGRRPGLRLPFRMALYPLPCLLALGGWLYLYGSAGWLFIALGQGTLLAGVIVFLLWSWRTGRWPFAAG
jgi:amino acid transporter